MHKIHALIADDHTLFRERLRTLLAEQPDIKVVGEAADGHQTLRMAEAFQPDILLLDIWMPEVDGLEVLAMIRAKSPRTKVLILSSFFEDKLVTEALYHGAKGYLMKTLTNRDLVKAIRTTHAGELWVERKVLAAAFEGMLQKSNSPHCPLPDLRQHLTEREQEIVKYVTQSMTNKEVATQLGISDATVKAHLAHIFSKLKVHRRLQLLLRQIADRTDHPPTPSASQRVRSFQPRTLGREPPVNVRGPAKFLLKNTPNG